MRKVILYIAISLDGKIADKDGNFEWLEEIPNPDKNDYGYQQLMKRIDTTIMGNTTYQQVRAFSEFPYKDKKNYVISRNTKLSQDEYATFLTENQTDFVRDLKKQPGKNIWLIGGGEVNTLLHQAELIDEFMVFVMPIIVGQGIPLFSDHHAMKQLRLLDQKAFPSGVVLLHYAK